MKPSRRIASLALRLAAPFRRRHPVVLGGSTVTEASRLRVTILPTGSRTTSVSDNTDYYLSEHDPSDEAGA